VQDRVNDRIDQQQQQLIASGSSHIVSGTEVQVSQNMVQRFAVWFGGSVLGSQPQFGQIAHSKA
jgi:actin-related protein